MQQLWKKRTQGFDFWEKKGKDKYDDAENQFVGATFCGEV